MNKLLSLSAVSAAVLLSACATPSTPPPELLSARAAVRNAETDPRVLNHAPLELKKATDSLNKANALSAKRESLADVASAAYVAERQAQTALAIAAAKSNEESIKSAQADRERARADARAAEASRAQAQAAAARMDASAARADASTARTDADSARAQAGDAEARAAAARMQATQAQMQASSLAQQLSELQAKSTDRGMLVTLGDLLFEFGRAEIKPSGHAALRKLASYLNEHPERRILIEGYTDSVGSDSANLTLSQRRAESVAAALASLGVSWARINTKGYGESYPVAENTTDTNRALNRRVEVYISDNDRPVRARG